MSNNVIIYGLMGIAGLFLLVIIAYLILMKRMNRADIRQQMALRVGVEAQNFSLDVIYQKLYMFYIKVPGLKRYLVKLRKRLEIINIEDEYLTRRQSAKILTNALLIIIPLTFFIIAVAKNNTLLMAILIIFEIFMIETLIGRNGR